MLSVLVSTLVVRRLSIGLLKTLVSTVAPTIGTALGGPMGGMAANMISEVLGCDPEPKKIQKAMETATPEQLAKLKKVETDFETGRGELYKLLEKGNQAIDGILALAKEGEHPRAYEVAGQLIKGQSEIAQNLLDLQDKLKKILGDMDGKFIYESPDGGKTITKRPFGGAPSERVVIDKSQFVNPYHPNKTK